MRTEVKKRPIITLTTDLGLHDEYVGCMKGVILALCRDAVLIDLTHDIEAQNITLAAMSIANSYRCFPAGTIHIVVVDPGVGSKRHILALQAEKHIFIAPDNGILTPFLGRDKFHRAFIIDNSNLFLHNVSTTFHGRDIMAPIAARLADGMDIAKVGPQITSQKCQRIHLPEARLEDGKIIGEIIHIDHFGNLRTSIVAEDIAHINQKDMEIRVGGHVVNIMRHSYSEAKSDGLIALFDSRGHLEIAVNKDSAALKYGCRIGDLVTVTKIPKRP